MLNAIDSNLVLMNGLSTAVGAQRLASNDVIFVVAVTIGSPTATTTMSATGVTWALIGRQAGSSVTSELWIGYGWTGGNGTPSLVNTPSVSVSRLLGIGMFDTGASQTSARTTTSIAATGTSTTTDPGGTRSAPAGGAWFQSTAINAAITPTARTGGQAYALSLGSNLLGCALYYRSGQLDQNAVQVTETITSNNWAVVSGTTTLDQPSGVTGNAYKGRDTLYLDQNEEA